MRKRPISLREVTIGCLLYTFFQLSTSGEEPKTSANILENWRQEFLQCVRNEALSPNLMVRTMTIFSVSVHDALNSVKPRYRTYLEHPDSGIENLNPEAVVAGCGWTVSQALHPYNLRGFQELSKFARLKDAEKSVKESFLHGQKIASKILANRRGDGASTSISYIATTAPGQWRRTPDFYRPPEKPHWKNVRLWALPDEQSFLPPPPPSFHSAEYVSAVSEVKIRGGSNSQLRTPEQSFIAKFWKDFSYTQTPPGHWNEIANFVARSLWLDLWEEARLFALLNLAMSDAGIIAWKAKYKYHLWRPVDAIRLADEFPSTRKLANHTWSPFLESPPHPEYPSAHSCFSGAASRMLELLTGNDRFIFRVSSDQFKGKYRRFSRFSTCAEEIGKSRLYGGIHFSFSNENGLSCGRKIGKFTHENFLQNLQKP